MNRIKFDQPRQRARFRPDKGPHIHTGRPNAPSKRCHNFGIGQIQRRPINTGLQAQNFALRPTQRCLRLIQLSLGCGFARNQLRKGTSKNCSNFGAAV